MNPIRLPKPNEPIESGGLVTRTWLDFFRSLAGSTSLEELQAALAQAQEAIDQLQNSGGLPLDTKIIGDQSVNVDGILSNGVVSLSLVNDQLNPSPSSAYGSNPSGVKGFYSISDAIESEVGQISKTVGLDGVTTLGLDEVENSGSGSVLAITIDEFGRVVGTREPTTDDLAQGEDNLYFPEAPVDGETYGRRDGGWVGVTSGSGTVTSVAMSVPTGLQVTGTPITTSGTLSVSYQSGYVGYTTTERTKLSGISAGAQVNVATNIAQGTRTATTVPVTSSTGTGATLSAATTSLAGVMASADKAKLDGVAAGATVYTDAMARSAAVADSITDGVTNVAPSQNSVFDALAALIPAGYIDGLALQWVSGTEISINSGAAYIQSSGTLLRSSSAISKSGLSLSASTWHHVYLFSNSGVPDIEVVTTPPASPYNGTARSKSGDSSRRYLGSISTDPSGNAYRFQQSGPRIYYVTNIISAPFQVVNGTASSSTIVSCAAVAPETATSIMASFANNDPAVTVLLGNNASPPSGSPISFIAQVGRSLTSEGEIPMGTNQTFNYMFLTPPSANFVARVKGYLYER